MLSEAQISRVVTLLDERFGLDALVLFGSDATGTARNESDIDLAALFQRMPTAIDLLDAESDVARLVGRDVDLVDLAATSPILAMQVQRTGRCLFGAESPALANFQATLPGRYEDLKRVRAEAESALVRRVVHGRS
jgi:predicted nucleotidyltransferase